MSKAAKERWRKANRARSRSYAANYRAANPGKLQRYRNANKRRARGYELLRKFGLSIGQYDSMLAQQKGLCAVCSQPPAKVALSVDHCHETGKIRKLLCSNCNQALGLMKDDAARLYKAAEYLKSHE